MAAHDSAMQLSDSQSAAAAMSARIATFIDRQPGSVEQREAGAPKPDYSGAGIPLVDKTEFCAAALRAAIRNHGALIVRGLFPVDFAREYTRIIDRVMESCDYNINSAGEGCDRTYFNPPGILSEVMSADELARGRAFRRNSGSVLCVEAPAVAERLLTIYEEMGLRDIITEHFGEAPCLSVKKWVLRKLVLPVNSAGWHQDGAFMGTAIKSLNLWIPLTACGADTGAPGMDVVPRRLNRIMSSDGAPFDWCVSDSTIARELADTPITSPEFSPGDAFFFDHFYLHRTQYQPSFCRTRYAIETWFFGSNYFPANQIPLAW